MKGHVEKELESYVPLTSVGEYILVNDTVLAGLIYIMFALA